MTLPLALNTPQYFFDDTLIAHQQRLVRRWLPAKIYPEPVIVPDKPWESRMLVLFGTVLEYSGGYRMYYCDFAPNSTSIRLSHGLSGTMTGSG